jgi:hypothetical protein
LARAAATSIDQVCLSGRYCLGRRENRITTAVIDFRPAVTGRPFGSDCAAAPTFIRRNPPPNLLDRVSLIVPEVARARR